MTGTARWLIGDVRDRLADLEDGSVQSVITSPPYWRKRRYLPADHPEAHREIGQEPSPGEFLASLLAITDELWRVVADDGTIWFNLGDTASGSGGAGGDYLPGGQREGQEHYVGSGRTGGNRPPRYIVGADGDTYRDRSGHGARGVGAPRAKSVCWIPELFGASLAYGRNLLTGEPCRQWITRPPVTWCKPAPTPGEIIDKFREADELIVWAAKRRRYYFDLDSVREAPKAATPRALEPQARSAFPGHPGEHDGAKPMKGANPKGVPPLTWWVVNTSSYDGAHYATFPPELITRPVIASCPPDGTILDPFAGSGTTLAVAVHHGRNAIGIDFDERNLRLGFERVGEQLRAADDRAAQLLEQARAERDAGTIFELEEAS